MQKASKFDRALCSLAAGLLIFLGCATLNAATVLDPALDTFGSNAVQHDILSIDFDSGINITINFAGPVAAPSSSTTDPTRVGGYIAIDTNADADLGNSLFYLRSNPLPATGIDYYIDLYSEADTFLHGGSPLFVDVLDSSLTVVDTIPIAYGLNSLSLTVSPSSLGNPDPGLIRVGAIVATLDTVIRQGPTIPGEFTDQAPNLADAPVPEPTSFLLFACGIAGVMGYAGRSKFRCR